MQTRCNEIKTHHFIPAYAICKKNRYWLWSVWANPQKRLSDFEEKQPNYSGRTNTRSEAITKVGKILDLNLLECKIYMVSHATTKEEGMPAYQQHAFRECSVVQLWGTYAKEVTKVEK
jgi:hypothetical protein